MIERARGDRTRASASKREKRGSRHGPDEARGRPLDSETSDRQAGCRRLRSAERTGPTITREQPSRIRLPRPAKLSMKQPSAKNCVTVSFTTTRSTQAPGLSGSRRLFGRSSPAWIDSTKDVHAGCGRKRSHCSAARNVRSPEIDCGLPGAGCILADDLELELIGIFGRSMPGA